MRDLMFCVSFSRFVYYIVARRYTDVELGYGAVGWSCVER
jgi:hypothetical protein